MEKELRRDRKIEMEMRVSLGETVQRTRRSRRNKVISASASVSQSQTLPETRDLSTKSINRLSINLSWCLFAQGLKPTISHIRSRIVLHRLPQSARSAMRNQDPKMDCLSVPDFRRRLVMVDRLRWTRDPLFWRRQPTQGTHRIGPQLRLASHPPGGWLVLDVLVSPRALSVSQENYQMQ